MGKFIDLTGQRFGRWTVIDRCQNTDKGQTQWLCKCQCGIEKVIISGNLKHTNSCGCYQKELAHRIGFKDISGQKFGMLTVIEYAGKNKHGQTLWDCACECGRHKIVGGTHLRTGHTKSCGCYHHKLLISGVLGQKNRMAFGKAAFNALFKRYKKDAQKRNLPFELEEYFFQYTTSQPCFYCGKLPSNIYSSRNSNTGNYIYNGIDRVNSNGGYTKNNIVSCCFDCNSAKRIMSQQEFLSWIERVYKHSIENKEK